MANTIKFLCTDVGDSMKSIAFKLTPVGAPGDLPVQSGPIVIEVRKPDAATGKASKAEDLPFVFELGATYVAAFELAEAAAPVEGAQDILAADEPQ